MNIKTKLIAGIAAFSLFAYTANAQTATIGANDGPPFLANFTIEPAADGAPVNFVTDNSSAEALIDDGQENVGTNLVVTNLNKAGTALASVTNSLVGNGAQGPNTVIIQNDGINLNTVTTSTNTASLDRYTQSVQTVDLDPSSPTFTDSVTVFTAWATAAGEGPNGTRIFEDDGTATDLAGALLQVDNAITAIDANNAAVAAALVVDANPTTTGGTLNVGGNLSVGAIGDVESAVAANTAKVGYTDAAVTANAAVAANTAKVGITTAQANDITTNNGKVGITTAQANDITTNNGKVGITTAQANDITTNNSKVGYTDAAVDARIAGLGVSDDGITGVIERSIVNGEEVVQLGSNTFFFNGTTDTISTSSGDINLDADVAVTGDLDVAGDVFVGGRALGLQSQIDTNRQDIDRNARGIAMVAALQHTTVLPGMTHALDLSAAHFEGETGMALNYARRLSDNVQLNFGAAATSDFDESVIKGGIGWQW